MGFFCCIFSHGGCDQKGEFFLDGDHAKIYFEDKLCKEIGKCEQLKKKPKIGY